MKFVRLCLDMYLKMKIWKINMVALESTWSDVKNKHDTMSNIGGGTSRLCKNNILQYKLSTLT